MLAFVGAVIGLNGVCVGLVARPRVAEIERHRTSRHLLGLRVAIVGGLIAGAGWLVLVFVAPSIGSPILITGILAGIAGIVMHNIVLVTWR